METIRRYFMLIDGAWVGGYRQSGPGRERGPHALDAYTEGKSVHLDLSGRLDRRACPLLLSPPPD